MSTKRIKKITAIVVILVGLIVAGYYSRVYYDSQEKTHASQVSFEFIEAITSGRVDAAYKLTSTALQEKQDQKIFDGNIGNVITNNLAVEEGTLIKGDQDGKKAFFYSQKAENLPPLANGRTDALFSLVLVKEKGSWRISNVFVQ